jgi:hypothetical protein
MKTLDRAAFRAVLYVKCVAQGIATDDETFDRIVNGAMLAEAENLSKQGHVIVSISVEERVP